MCGSECESGREGDRERESLGGGVKFVKLDLFSQTMNTFWSCCGEELERKTICRHGHWMTNTSQRVFLKENCHFQG